MQQKILSDKKFNGQSHLHRHHRKRFPAYTKNGLDLQLAANLIRFFILRHVPNHENYLTKVLEVPVSMTSLAELSEILTMFSTATFV